jgi:hypothetical protein
MTMTNSNSVENFLSAATPQYQTSSFLSASMPTPADVTAAQTPESPPSRTYLIVADQSYRVLYETHSQPSAAISNVRASMTVAILVNLDNDLEILRAALLGGTAALLLPSGVTVSMFGPAVDSMKYLDMEFPDFPKFRNRNRICVVTLSAPSDRYRST